MIGNPPRQPRFIGSIVMAAVLISFTPRAGFGGPATRAVIGTDPLAALSSNSLPPGIITTDGQTYNAVKLLRVLPDGLLVQFQPDSGGMGLARLRFVKLSPALQQQFGYDPEKASDYERGEKQVMVDLSRRLRLEDNIRIGVLEDTTHSPVTVKASQPAVSYAYYDPAAGKPSQITADMDGVTQYAFGCSPTFTFHVGHPGAGEPFDFHIDAVNVQLGLTIRITLPRGECRKLRQHEDGHRKIVAYFYSLGPAAARNAASLWTGIDQTSSLVDYDAAKKQVFGKATSDVEAEYLRYTQELCSQANDYYDDLTDHGRNGMDSNQAADEAIRQYAPQVAE
ncbi:MAG TPA: hypothetical protein VME24_11855 [Alphaproteobacteria bacterium]|nr:hypothetical protein [Alphaproteobacteria bacterium]